MGVAQTDQELTKVQHLAKEKEKLGRAWLWSGRVGKRKMF